jgi:hypothetical protein
LTLLLDATRILEETSDPFDLAVSRRQLTLDEVRP